MNGIDAEQRIRDLKKGTDLADIEIFQNVSRTRATKEILILFPNAFARQHGMGAIELAADIRY